MASMHPFQARRAIGLFAKQNTENLLGKQSKPNDERSREEEQEGGDRKSRLKFSVDASFKIYMDHEKHLKHRQVPVGAENLQGWMYFRSSQDRWPGRICWVECDLKGVKIEPYTMTSSGAAEANGGSSAPP